MKLKAQLSIEFLLSFMIVMIAASIFLSAIPNIDNKSYYYDIAFGGLSNCYYGLTFYTNKTILCIERCENEVLQESEECKKSNILN
jgi:hypothetical protein